MDRLLIEERYTWPVRTVLLGGGSLRATSYQIAVRVVNEEGQESHLCLASYASLGTKRSKVTELRYQEFFLSALGYLVGEPA